MRPSIVQKTNADRFALRTACCLMILLVVPALPCYSHGLSSSVRLNHALERQRPRIEASLAKKHYSWGTPIYLRIFKKEKRLEVWLRREQRFHLFKTYPICTYGGMGLGPKTRQGDGFAPEGFYVVRPGQMNPYSRFHLAFNLGYPNAYDRYYGRTGSALMVHGNCVSIGCFAMTDKGMEEIYLLAHAALIGGQSRFMVHIFPFEMTPKHMKHYRASKWFDFWCNLKEGYDGFEKGIGTPPEIIIRDGRYIFVDRGLR